MNPDAPIFIGGYMHSGTTLLKNILGNHSRIFAFQGETKLFESEDLLVLFNNEESKTAFTNYLITCHVFPKGNERTSEKGLEAFWKQEADKIKACKNKGEILAFVGQYFANKNNKTTWLEKSPNNIFFTEEILKCFPNGKIIEIIRDGRDVLASKKVRKDRLTQAKGYAKTLLPIKKYEKQYAPFWDLMGWKGALKAGEQAQKKHPYSILRIHYEELVNNPEPILKNICEFIGLSFDDEMLTLGSKRNAADKALMQNGASVDQSSVKKFSKVLTKREVAFSERYCFKQLTKNHYSLTTRKNDRKVFNLSGLYMGAISGLATRVKNRIRMPQYTLIGLLKLYLMRFKRAIR